MIRTCVTRFQCVPSNPQPIRLIAFFSVAVLAPYLFSVTL